MWTPPFFDCGECGGQIGRWPMTNLLRQQILDWRHVTVPDGVTPHRAVLGTPGHLPSRGSAVASTPPTAEDGIEQAPPPEVPARPALDDELPSSAGSLLRLAAEMGWETEQWFMRGTRMDSRWRPGGVRSSVVLRMRRDGHRLVGVWTTPARDHTLSWGAKDWPGAPFAPTWSPWSFDEAYSLTHYSDLIGSPELRNFVRLPRAICEECGEPPALHVLCKTGVVCFTEFINNPRGTTWEHS